MEGVHRKTTVGVVLCAFKVLPMRLHYQIFIEFITEASKTDQTIRLPLQFAASKSNLFYY